MIRIHIGGPEKLSNNILVKKSAFVSFDYNPDIVSFIKKMGTRIYNPDNHTWEMPINNIISLCNKFENEEIQISGIYEDLHKQEFEVDIPKDFKFKTKPFNHQIDGVRFGLNKKKFLLCDDQGLGKTKQIIDFVGCLEKTDKINKVLIVCGVNSLKYNWQSEIGIHSNEKGWVLGTRFRKTTGKAYEGSTKDKLEDLDNLPDCRYIITNIETLRAGAEKISKSKYHFPIAEKLQQLCKNGTISVIAFDECHKCFDYNTLIKTDLGELKIGDVVENKINCNVLSYNEITKTFEYKPIVNFWKNNTSDSKFIELTFEDDNGNEKKIKCTDDHLFLTKNRGWVMAKYLTEYDDFDL